MADLFDSLVQINAKPACQKGGNTTVQRNPDSVASAEKVSDCGLCRDQSGIFDFSLVCCRVRHILGEPRLEVRQAWIERWRRRDGLMCKVVEQEVAARWNNGKEKKRGRGA